MVTQAPFDWIKKYGTAQNITVEYSEAYPGTGTFAQVPSSMFPDGLNVTYWTTADWTGPINQTLIVPNITAGNFHRDTPEPSCLIQVARTTSP